ncbi:hypothetical protein DRE_06097 [Drechslerella stenobrocha 248]|uniref:AMP-activated protein kinase glycogen-binding domain-containing protein n=1 Tax=Drechslerella stenobrocha 248 TaxID=1043628 RepID=W7HPZ4_9PEZI|nr:hypothetical protein DRE_06097 [Drechslerella stenobrocha 248]
MSKGTYTFKWSAPADEVFVTGSFDDWKKTEKLAKTVDGTHLSSVELPIEKTTYKYVVDGTWTVDTSQRIEKDASGNDNNFLLPEDIVPVEEPIFQVPMIPMIPDTAYGIAPFLQSTGPIATTIDLAAEVPLEPKRDLAAEEADSTVIKEPAHPIPNTVSSVGPEATTVALAAEVPLEEVAKTEPIVPEATKVVVAPEDLPTPDPRSVPGFLPDTFDEPVSVNPIPASETATNPIQLEPNEPVPPSTASVTDNVKLDKESYEQADASNLGVGAAASAALAAVSAVSDALSSTTETVKNLIPESVLPIVAGSEPEDHTTATTETVPLVVVESQTKAEVEPEASAHPEAVEAKQEVEEEVIAKVELVAPIEVTSEALRTEVPEVVRESQAEASAPLEASEFPVAVEGKKEVEAELKSEVAPAEAVPDHPTEKPSEIPAVPEVVVSSIEAAGVSPEATANTEAVEAKHEVEAAIVKEIQPEVEVPKAEEPKVEEPKAEEPKAEEPKAEEPKAEEPSTAEKPAEPVAAAVAEPVATAAVTEPVTAPVDAPAAVPADKAEKAASESSKSKKHKSAEVPKDEDAKKKKKKNRISAFFHKVAKKLS